MYVYACSYFMQFLSTPVQLARWTHSVPNSEHFTREKMVSKQYSLCARVVEIFFDGCVPD